ncbi:sugar phosphate isomerase/epimerase [Amaricoccus sp.]|uniref:sugar phosphate isomerase/epimerase family protein n=1 Tax=Amaricoccus sp. TaxID=1872485 RepID=UPI001B4D44C0|nr:sugar phosphate isomerase/epimerase [Amaricoccus sp.]MBP7001416.1 sugar phosphate isomerase/epimerase [Amaricoccus sp.]
MRIGFNLLLWTGFVTEEHGHALETIKAAGYDGVEIPLFDGDPAQYEVLGRRIADLGLGVTAVGLVPDAERSPISADARAREGAAAHLRWLVDCTKALRADVLCGPFHQPLGVFSGAGPTEEELARLVEAHRAMADYAGDLTLAIEPLNRFECYVLNTAAQAAAHVRAVRRPNFGYLYDTFHANIEEKDPVGVIAETATQITHVHISENDRGTPGKGHVPLAETLAALKAVGYDGWLTIEAFGLALPALAAATRVWRKFYVDETEVVRDGIKAIRAGLAA